DLPFERLVSELGVPRDLSRTPLFQVLLALQNAPAAVLDRPGLALAPLPLEAGAAKFDLTFEVQESAGGLGVYAEYDRDLFDAATVRRLLVHFEVLLGGAAEAPETPLSALPLLPAAERHQI